jgi:hypothetical protein
MKNLTKNSVGIIPSLFAEGFAEILTAKKMQTVEFVSLVGVTTKAGKKSNVVVRVGQTYESAKQKSIQELLALPLLGLPEEEKAREELLASFRGEVNKSLSEGQKNAYIYLGRNFRIHKQTGELQFNGVKHSEKVLEEGVYPNVNSRPKTITKRTLKAKTTMGKWRSYNLSPEQVKALRFRGNELILAL